MTCLWAVRSNRRGEERFFRTSGSAGSTVIVTTVAMTWVIKSSPGIWNGKTNNKSKLSSSWNATIDIHKQTMNCTSNLGTSCTRYCCQKRAPSICWEITSSMHHLIKLVTRKCIQQPNICWQLRLHVMLSKDACSNKWSHNWEELSKKNVYMLDII